MNTTQNNKESWFTKCKRIFIEQLWLIFLLAPLLIIAFMITKHYEPTKHQILLSKHTGGLSFSAEITSVPMGLDAGDFGTIKRADGKVQTTYKGQPLYYFISDNNPGDTNGQGVYNSWYVVAP